jgi:hypothetical protein
MAKSSTYRERVLMPGWVVPALGALGGLLTFRRVRRAARRGRPAWRQALTLINSVMTLMTALRFVRGLGSVAVEVEEESIHVGLGTTEQRIPVASIRDVRVASYNPVRFLGWGHKSGLGGRQAFSQMGVRRGIEIVATDGSRERTYFISSNTPEALASAVAGVAGVPGPA